MKPKIFVSSTVYDLLDVRAEIAAHLSAMRLSVLLSDSAVSDFTVSASDNSIETCLANVRDSDQFVVALSRRYGPSLASVGYDDVSATHLEYREAVKADIPILFYVRDRLEGEYRVWRKNKEHPPKLNWVLPKDYGIFKLIDEHQQLTRNTSRSNWLHIFRSSVDLKEALSTHLGGVARKRRFLDDASDNRVPAFGCSTEVSTSRGTQNAAIHCRLRNVGGSPAFNVYAYWKEEGKREPYGPFMAPGDEIHMGVLAQKRPSAAAYRQILVVEYSTHDGNLVYDEFSVQFRAAGDGGYEHGARLLSKQYRLGHENPVENLIVETECEPEDGQGR